MDEKQTREQLHKILKDTELSYIIRMLNMVTTRFKNVEWLNQIIFRQELNATEVAHVQNQIEKMTWFFGEQYATLGSQEDNFEKILRQYRVNLGDFSEITPMEDQNKKKEVDLFLSRKMINARTVDNLIVELKRPSINLTLTPFFSYYGEV